MWNTLLAAIRTSEFWVVLSQVVIEVVNAPVPEELRLFGWVYAGLRVVGKMAKYIFPNPSSRTSGWLRKD